MFAAHELYGPTELLERAVQAEAAGFDEIEFLSTGPDQEKFIQYVRDELGR